MSEAKNNTTKQESPARCERCGRTVSLTSRGKLRKGKRFCSAKCQQTSIKNARAKARLELRDLLDDLEQRIGAEGGVAALRRALHTLGMLTLERAPSRED